MKFFLLFFFSISTLIFGCLSQSEGSSTTTSILSSAQSQSSPSSSPSTTVTRTSFVSTSSLTSRTETTSLSDECYKLNSTCEECLSNNKCFFCFEDNSCKLYKVKGLFPEGCKASQARWFSCSVNFEALLIGLISAVVVVLLILGCCVCYCCNKTCKAMSDRSLQRFERNLKKKKDFIKQKNSERKREREAKNDAIRVKYGLKPSTYSSLEE
ncbi:pituitary tumor-transforming protein 1 -interacting -like protein [Brachionus plicatilis]|uniref:Pituitary tumor-transforming protein 1-interacting-like protein n=1 Tax=Brachionus plicatilis TaxID=10195 RepID=A0A3M7R247_BRAPC|nr:pituitary tumor-transforming protein 1 -interacting -like protein [Brachionus plicatilis]